MTLEQANAEEDVMPLTKFTADDIYKAIADGLLSFDLYRHDISDTHRALAFRDDTAREFNRRIEDSEHDASTLGHLAFSLEIGAQVVYEGIIYTITLVGDTGVVMHNESGTSEISITALRSLFDEGKVTIRNLNYPTGPRDTRNSALDVLSPKQLEEALQRARMLELAQTSPESVTVSKRSIQRFKKAVREAGDGAIERNLALVSRVSERGNRERKISEELINLVHQVGKSVYNNPKAVTKKHAYQQFVAQCQNLGLRPCSEKTFAKELARTSSVRAREGKRQAYQKSPIVWYLKLNEAIHGVRPFQYVHIDHTPLDILLRLPNSQEVLGRPWISLAIDAESRAVVGFYLSFEAPSYRSCMMVLRDIVRRHGRLPEMLVTDNGKEFHSASFQRACALYQTHLRYRPAGKPRHGSVMERIFGTIHSQLVHNLEGNTKLMKHVRTVTKSVRPENFVSWTLPALHGALDYYFRNIYGTEIHPAHGKAPEDYLAARLIETGVRRNRWVRYDNTFMIETCPSVDQTGSRVVDSQRGIKINHVWYWTEAFRNANWGGKSIDVRIDPWDVRYCYVLLENQWHRCISKLSTYLKGYTEVELRYAFEELAKKHGIKKRELTPERIAEWARVLDARNFDSELRQQQAETRRIYERLNMTQVEVLDPSVTAIENDATTQESVEQQLSIPSGRTVPAQSTLNELPNKNGIEEEDESDEFELF